MEEATKESIYEATNPEDRSANDPAYIQRASRNACSADFQGGGIEYHTESSDKIRL